MLAFLSRYEDYAYALLRIITGAMFLCHGAQKLFGWPSPAREGTPDWLTYIGGPIELIGGALVMIGLFTRPAAFICSGMMAVAYWYAHGMRAFLPINNGGELAALYCFLFLFIACRGGGLWAMDKRA